MSKYVLIYGRPRASDDGASVIFEAQRVHSDCDDDADAIRWALQDVPRDFGMRVAEIPHPALPIALWRLEAFGRSEMVWERAPGAALRAPG